MRTDGNPQTIDIHDPLSSSNSEKYNEAQLKIIRDFYHRNLEVTILATAGVYVLNLLDAYISAHLLDFDISDDKSIGKFSKYYLPDSYGKRCSSGCTF